MRCWWCGVEPDRLLDITQLGSAEPEYLPVWPAGDHKHAEKPPTPGQLAQAGHEALTRVLAQ